MTGTQVLEPLYPLPSRVLLGLQPEPWHCAVGRLPTSGPHALGENKEARPHLPYLETSAQSKSIYACRS